MAYSIRKLATYDEMSAVHQLQLEIWGQSDPSFAIYPPIMNTAAKNGGVVLGAFDGETNQIVAFLFSFLGRDGKGPLKLCSQVMGVREAWRRQGIAEALKREQRKCALEQDLPLITWTYDPLQGPNAHLNLHKLRAISRTYWQDVYGSNFGALNAGLPSDRLLVEWWIQNERPELPYAGQALDLPPIFEVTGKGTSRRVESLDLALKEKAVLLEIPGDIASLKRIDMDLALDWRYRVREAFEAYFANDFIAVDFVSQQANGSRYNYYVLQKATSELLASIGITAP